MRNGKITHNMLSASSERDLFHLARQSRLFNGRAWCSARSEYEKYLEVNFGSSAKELTAFATQGHPSEYKWMSKYELRYALGARWFRYEINGKPQVYFSLPIYMSKCILVLKKEKIGESLDPKRRARKPCLLYERLTIGLP